jgi:hypothetical protein
MSDIERRPPVTEVSGGRELPHSDKIEMINKQITREEVTEMFGEGSRACDCGEVIFFKEDWHSERNGIHHRDTGPCYVVEADQ